MRSGRDQQVSRETGSPRVASRLVLVGLLALVIGLGLAARHGLGGWWAKYAGVALWSVMAYLGVLLVRPALRPLTAALLTLAVSWAVELAQLSPVPAWLASRSLLLRLLLGSTFSGWDLPAYAAGVLLAALLHEGAWRVWQSSRNSG